MQVLLFVDSSSGDALPALHFGAEDRVAASLSRQMAA